MLWCVLVFITFVGNVHGLDVTNTTVQIVLAVCGALVGIVVIGVLVGCCCFYWYTKKQDMELVEEIQSRRLRMLRPPRTVAPGYISNGVSIEDFEYLHRKAREEYFGLPGQMNGHDQVDVDPDFRSYNRNGRQMHSPQAPPSYDQSERRYQLQRKSAEVTKNSTKTSTRDQPIEEGSERTELGHGETCTGPSVPSTCIPLDEGHLKGSTSSDILELQGEEEEVVQSIITSSSNAMSQEEIPKVPYASLPVANIESSDDHAATALHMSSGERASSKLPKRVRVINVEDSDHTKRIKKMSFAKRLRGEALRNNNYPENVKKEVHEC